MRCEASAAVDAIADCIDPKQPDVTNRALEVLVAIGRPGLPALLDALRHDSPDVRKSAATYSRQHAAYWAFRPNQRAETISALEVTLKDEVPEVRYAAALSKLWLGGDAGPLIPTLTEG